MANYRDKGSLLVLNQPRGILWVKLNQALASSAPYAQLTNRSILSRYFFFLDKTRAVAKRYKIDSHLRRFRN